eukprot:COSAG02_NODE_304_length_25204_cov_11.025095_4_plen_77_part_00
MAIVREAEERDQVFNEVVNMREAEERMPRPLREPLLRCPKIEVVIIISRSVNGGTQGQGLGRKLAAWTHHHELDCR